MSVQRTNWQIHVTANTKQAEASMVSLMRTASSAEGAFNSLNGMSGMVTQQIKATPRVFDNLARSVKSGKLNFEQYNRVLQHSGGLIKRQNQLWKASAAAMQYTDGSMGKTTATMRKFGGVSATMLQKVAMLNTATRALSTHIVDVGKNMQWAGRQITVGFTVPFGIAMIGASAAFLKFEEQVVRFRKVFNEEMSGVSTESAEAEVVNLATSMSKNLGVARNEILETAAEFAQMGKTLPEIKELTEVATNLALLGDVDRGTATNLLAAYEASDFDEIEGGLERITYHLNMVENTTRTSVADLSQALPQLIPVFQNMNLKFGEGEAILVGMNQALGNASESANALKVGMQRVYDPTKEAIDAFAEFDIDLLAMRERNNNDLTGFFLELGDLVNESIDNNTEFAKTIGNLFGVRQAGRLQAALNSIAEAASGAENDMSRATDVMGMSFQDLAATADSETRAITESLGGRLRRLKEGIIADIASIGQTFLEMAMPFFEMVGRFVKKFSELDEGTKKFLILGSAIASAFGGLVMITGIAINLFGSGLKFFTALIPTLKLITEEEFSMAAALKAYSDRVSTTTIPVNELTKVLNNNTAAMQANARAAGFIGPMPTQGAPIGAPKTRGGSGRARAGRKGMQRGGAPLAWRGSAGMASIGLAMGSMAVEDEGKANVMGAASSVLMMAQLMPSVNKGVFKLGEGLKEGSRGAKLLSGRFGQGVVKAASMVSKTNAVGIALGVAATGAYALYKQWKKSADAAKEFLKDVSAVSDEMEKAGMDGGGGLELSGGLTVEKVEEMGDLAGAVYEEMVNVREATKDTDEGIVSWKESASGFIAKALQAGNSIESINEVLSEIEEVQELASGTLTLDVEMNAAEIEETITTAFAQSIDNAIAQINFQATTANPDKRFNANDEFLDRTVGAATMFNEQLRMNPEEFWARSEDLFASIYGTEDDEGTRDDEILQEMAKQLRIEEDVYKSIETQKDFIIAMANNLEGIENMRDSVREDNIRVFAPELQGLMEERNAAATTERAMAEGIFKQMQSQPEIFGSLLERVTDKQGNLTNAGMKILSEEFSRAPEAMSIEIMQAMGRLRELDSVAFRDVSRFSDGLVALVPTLADLEQAVRNIQNLSRVGLDDPADDKFFLHSRANRNLVEETNNTQLEAAERQKRAAEASRKASEAAEKAAEKAEEAERKRIDAINEARQAVASIIGSLRSSIGSQRDELISEVLDQYEEETDKIIDAIEKQRDAEVEAMEDRKEAISEYLEEQDKLQDSMSSQLDLVMAIARGDVDRAAQLQNEMMFQGVDAVADAELDRLDEQVDGINKKYDLQVDRERELREEQRKTLQQNLEDVAKTTAASKEEWDKMYGEITSMARQAGVDITDNIREMGAQGFQNAIDEWTIAVTEDERWKRLADGLAVQFGNVGQALGAVAFEIGKALSGRVDLSTIEAMASMMKMEFDADVFKANNAATNMKDWESVANVPSFPTGSVPGNTQPKSDPEPKKNYNPGGGKRAMPGTFRHSGGPIGNGPPKDVPIVAQTGEYMIQRKAAQALGMEQLEALNNAHKYHTGGMITAPVTAIAQKGMGIGFLNGVAQRVMAKREEMVAQARAASAAQYDPSLNSGFTGSSKGILKAPDADWTKGSSKYYGGWTYGLAAGIAEKAATGLARLSGAQAVVNAYRDDEHNRRVGGSPNSDHRKGKAVDFVNAGGATTPTWVDRMGAWFEKQPGVRWVGRPATDLGGGHDDHVHVSYYHSGGPISLRKGGKIMQDNVPANLHKGELVLRRPLAQSLETGIDKLNADGGGVTNNFNWNIENYGGSPADARKLMNDVETMIDRKYRRGNPTRRIQ